MPYKKRAGVYQIRNTVTGKVYIGSSVSVYARKSAHFHYLKGNKHKNEKLQNSFNKYGQESFVFEVLEYVEDVTKLAEREQYYIDLYNASEKGYNILAKADSSLGYKHSEEVKKEISKRQKGEGNYFWGKHLLEEHKVRISKGNRGKKHSKEAVERTRKGHFKPIINIDTNKEYEYISQAAEELGVSVTAISNVLRGKALTCSGYHWKYKETKYELS